MVVVVDLIMVFLVMLVVMLVAAVKLTMIIRIKEIIITAGGENVAPTNIEEEIKLELPEVKKNVVNYN